MELRGRISDLATTGNVSTFLLRSADGSETRIASSKPLPPGLKNGETVVVNGVNPTDPPFLADSVVRVDTGKKIPWVLIGSGACALLIIALVVYFVTRPSGSTWTITATDSGAGASNVPIQLLDATKAPLSTGTTGADGSVAFKNLKNGTYFATGPGATPITTTFTKDTTATSPLAVQSPYTWVVRTLLCGRADANNQLNLISSANLVLKTGVTGSTGQFAFTNLSTGAYRVLGPSTASGSATVDGKSRPALLTMSLPNPSPCYIFNPITAHPLVLATRPGALQTAR